MDIKFGEVWKPMGPFRTPTFVQFNTKPLMLGQARCGSLGWSAPPLGITLHTEVEEEQQEGSDSSMESNLSQLLDIHI